MVIRNDKYKKYNFFGWNTDVLVLSRIYSFHIDIELTYTWFTCTIITKLSPQKKLHNCMYNNCMYISVHEFAGYDKYT